MTSCFRCGADDHLASECPRKVGAEEASTRASSGAPATWCSYCDEATRLVDLGYAVQRCPDCHPLRFQSLAQARKCPDCNATVHEWDHSPCGRHSQPGMPLHGTVTRGWPGPARPGPGRTGA